MCPEDYSNDCNLLKERLPSAGKVFSVTIFFFKQDMKEGTMITYRTEDTITLKSSIVFLATQRNNF